MVTVELAIGFVTIALLIPVLTGVVASGASYVSCERSAAEVARQLARGDQDAANKAKGEAPDGTSFDTADRDKGIEVAVAVPVKIFQLPQFEVACTAWALKEVGVP